MLRGWFGYFKHATPRLFRNLDGFIRRRLRAILRKQEKRPAWGEARPTIGAGPMPSSRLTGCSPCTRPMSTRDTPDEETSDWRAVCGRTARTVRRAGRAQALPDPYRVGNRRGFTTAGDNVVLAAGVLALSGCGGSQDPAGPQFAPPCPQPVLIRPAEDLTRYNGAGRDLTDMVLDGRITGLQGSCRLADKPGQLDVSVQVAMESARGPAAPPPRARRAVFRRRHRRRADPGQADANRARGVPAQCRSGAREQPWR